MKKLFLAMLVAIAMVGCRNANENDQGPGPNPDSTKEVEVKYDDRSIDERPHTVEAPANIQDGNDAFIMKNESGKEIFVDDSASHSESPYGNTIHRVTVTVAEIHANDVPAPKKPVKNDDDQ